MSENGYISVDFSREVFDDTNQYWLLKLHKFDENMQEMASWTFDGNHPKESTAEIGLSKGVYYIKATPRKIRLTAWRHIYLHIFRHLAQKFLARMRKGKCECSESPPCLLGFSARPAHCAEHECERDNPRKRGIVAALRSPLSLRFSLSRSLFPNSLPSAELNLLLLRSGE